MKSSCVYRLSKSTPRCLHLASICLALVAGILGSLGILEEATDIADMAERPRRL